jgi:predicted ATPase
MKINTFSYINKTTDWELKPISLDQLTLLVGASGVGKTRILKCILDLKKISRGTSLNGVRWFVDFSTRSGNKCQWEGWFENKGFTAVENSEIDNKDKPKIEIEKLCINGDLVVDRNADGIIFNGVKTVKLSQSESVISLLKEEDQLKEVHTEFEQVIFDDNMPSLKRFAFDDDSKLSKYKNLQAIREGNEDIKLKLYLTYRNKMDVFNQIAEAFIEVFPYVKEIKVEPLAQNDKRLSRFLRDTPFIQIKEKGVKNWIDESKISSGMLRSLMHIAELYLCADSSVILIDEFENSLGVNCIDELTSSIVSAKRNLQFIITSHHPYIINNIDYSHWKLITRKAGAVIVHDAREFNFDKSKHKAFTQLINLDLYSEGVDA